MARTTANTKPAAETLESAEELVSVLIPRTSPEDNYTYVSVNDIGYSIRHGEATLVPPFIREELERSQKAREHFFDTVADEKSKARFA